MQRHLLVIAGAGMRNDFVSSRQDCPLVVRMGALGDMVMLTPLLRELYERTGVAADLAVCGDWNRVLFAHCPWVNNIYSVTSRNAPYWLNASKRQLVKALKQSNSERPWLVFEHLPAIHQLLHRAGLNPQRGVLAPNFPRRNGEHTCLQFARMADSALPLASRSAPAALVTQLHVPDSELAACQHWLAEKHRILAGQHKLILLQPGNKKTMRGGKRDRDSNIKYWPEQHWADVIRLLCDESPNTRVLLCGAPSEVALCREILQLCGDTAQVIQVADDLPLNRLMALTCIADACISVDTGPAHIAAATGCPLLVLFGKSDPRQFRPLGVNDVQVVARHAWQSFSGSAEDWAQCNSMSDISVAMVFERYQQLQPRSVPVIAALANHHSNTDVLPPMRESSAGIRTLPVSAVLNPSMA